MKIGILTHHYVKNFGAFLQAKGLLETIRSIRPDAEVYFIDYKNKKHWMINCARFFVFRAKRDTIISFFSKLGLLKTYSRYEHSLPRSKRVYSSKDINKLGIDILVVGSDEVWNFKDISYSSIKFGYGISVPKIVSYAASAGVVTNTDIIPQEAKSGLTNFSHISVRDINTQELVFNVLKSSSKMVLDPVYIYDFEVQCSDKLKNKVNKPYILIYDCRLDDIKIDLLRKYADNKGYLIIGAGEYKKWYSEYTTNISPFEWAYLFKNAQLVVTGTFHGVSFSLKYNKNFVAYLVEKNRINKVSSLLSQLNLDKRIIIDKNNDYFIQLFDQKIDYSSVNEILRSKIDESIDYIKEFLTN